MATRLPFTDHFSRRHPVQSDLSSLAPWWEFFNLNWPYTYKQLRSLAQVNPFSEVQNLYVHTHTIFVSGAYISINPAANCILIYNSIRICCIVELFEILNIMTHRPKRYKSRLNCKELAQCSNVSKTTKNTLKRLRR